MEYFVDDIVVLKKSHPCKEKCKTFKIIGYDGEVRLKCTNCQSIILLKKNAFLKSVKGKVEK